MEYIEQLEKPSKILKMQAIHGERTFVMCIPKDFIQELKISKGDYMKCWIKNTQLIVEKARSLKEHQTNLNTVEGGD